MRLVVASSFALLLTCFCFPALAQENTPGHVAEIRIAILAPLSGVAPTFGISTRDGALIAIDEWNARGGVLGRKIAPIVEDSQCNSDAAVNAANKVVNLDRVHYLIGEVCSKASIPISEIANAARVIQVSPASTHPGVTIDRNGATKLYSFRACFIDPFQGRVGAVFAYTRLHARKAFLIFDQGNAYGVGLSDNFETSFRRMGAQIVGKETYTSLDVDFSAILAKARAAKPDVIYLPDAYNTVNLVARQAKELGIAIPFLGGDGWDSPDLDLKATDGDYYTNHYSQDDPRPEVRNFLKAYGDKYKDDRGRPIVPDSLATLAYDATNLLLNGIKAAGADDTDMVRAALEKMTFSAVSGRIAFDAQHNPVKGAAILHIKAGRVVFDSFVSP